VPLQGGESLYYWTLLGPFTLQVCETGSYISLTRNKPTLNPVAGPTGLKLGPPWGTWWGGVVPPPPPPRTLRDSKKALCKWSISLYGSCMRGTWKEGFFTGNYESYIRHVN